MRAFAVSRKPVRRDQSPFAVGRSRRPGLLQIDSVPQLAGHLSMALIERLAVVGVLAQPHLPAPAQANLEKPVGIGKRLAGESHDVAGALPERGFGLLKIVNSSGDDDGRAMAARPNRGADPRRGLQISPVGSDGVQVVAGHTFVTARSGVWIR